MVQEAFDTTSMVLLSYFSSLTPMTNMGASFDGAEMMTYKSVAFICSGTVRAIKQADDQSVSDRFMRTCPFMVC